MPSAWAVWAQGTAHARGEAMRGCRRRSRTAAASAHRAVELERAAGEAGRHLGRHRGRVVCKCGGVGRAGSAVERSGRRECLGM